LIFKTTSIHEEDENGESNSNHIKSNNEPVTSRRTSESIKNILIKVKKNEKLKYRESVNEINECVIKKIKKIKNLCFEIIFIVFAFIFTLILISFFEYMSNKKDNDINNSIIKNKNNEWSYKCNLSNMDFAYNSLELIYFIVIAIKGNHLLEYENIFKITKYITYSLWIGIILGPLVNVIYYY